MSAHYPPLTCKEVKQILKNLDFWPLPRTGTSHEKWTNINHRSVTVDCSKEPFGAILMKYMANQAGVSKKEFYKALVKPKEVKKFKETDTVDI
jgi:hypothetical protein